MKVTKTNNSVNKVAVGVSLFSHFLHFSLNVSEATAYWKEVSTPFFSPRSSWGVACTWCGSVSDMYATANDA